MPQLSASARRLLDYLPHYYGGQDGEVDPLLARILEALAAEMDRARALLLLIRATTIPATADDSVGMLARWEALLRLPVQPADATIAQRQQRVIAALRGRRVAAGIDWTAAMTKAVGSTNWTAEENTPGDYQLRVTIPYGAGQANAGQIQQLARRFTPANLELVMRYEAGFIVGVSRVGDAI